MLIYLAICTAFLIFGTTCQRILGAGKWSVQSMQDCKNEAEMPWRVRVRRHRHNRTHDAFDADVTLPDIVDDSYDIRIEVCRKMDGGCKNFLTLADGLSAYFKRYMADNMRRALEAAGVDPPDFPVPRGQYHVENFILDTSNLSKEGIYGDYIAHTFVVKDGTDLVCVLSSVKYEPVDDFGVLPTNDSEIGTDTVQQGESQENKKVKPEGQVEIGAYATEITDVNTCISAVGHLARFIKQAVNEEKSVNRNNKDAITRASHAITKALDLLKNVF